MQQNDEASTESWFYASALVLSLSVLAIVFNKNVIFSRLDFLVSWIFALAVGCFCVFMGFARFFRHFHLRTALKSVAYYVHLHHST
jgi:uncharacterized membrane protein